MADLASQSTLIRSPDSFDSAVSHFSLPAFDSGAMPENCGRDEIKSNKFVLTEPIVLMSKLNPRIPRIWNISVLPDTLAVASTEFVALVPADLTTSELWAALSQPDVSTELANKVAGTSGSHQRVKPADVLALEVPDPRGLAADIRTQISALGVLVHSRRTEQRRLAATRDELLPLLMSGKVHVRDAERALDEAL